MSYKEKYEEWLQSPVIDEDTKAELRAVASDEDELYDRFYTQLEFGTAGLRGVIGAGENRMNVYTVRRATQGLANYIKGLNREAMGVAIAYDSRHMSPEFADTAALCLAANGIKAYVFETLRPTPELSFAVRYLKCTAGINITASHNPPEYNGYKVYWEDGAQITPPHDSGIMDAVKAIESYEECLTTDKEEAVKAGLYQVIGKDIDDPYIAEVRKQVKNPDAIKKYGKDLKIVYTPFHGTGLVPVTRVLQELGFENVYVVPEQAQPDGDFPTVAYPNPEDKAAFKLALDLAAEKDADLVLATDPDADRLGVYVKDRDGVYQVLTGNMSGCLLAEYTISQIKEKQGLPEDGALIKSIVSSNMADAIAKYYGIELIETLTGFKYIGLEILKMEETGKGQYLFGFEESYGCLIGTYARDKDAVVATMALCEAAAYYKDQGKNLWDVMLEMYERYGYYYEDVVSVTMKGADGIAKIGSIMEELRKAVPEEVGGKKVLRFRDFKTDTDKDMVTGETKTTGFPASNVLYFDFADGEWLCVRPSGTEPKIKLYIGVNGTSIEDARERAEIFKEKAALLLSE
ncbi:MAG: phospho-sugar mutase [Lachnospiraceae bacterium]|nr:phospho-sugar mutase [Lachnospiraceae bacterium]